MATGSVIDSKIVVNGRTINNVVIAGTKIFRVVADGHISYDRKEYTLTRNNSYSYSAPITGGTISFPSTAITSTYDGYNASGTRVNGAAASYATSPASISSNAHNTTSRSGNISVVQDNSQLTVTVPYTQAADSHEDVNVCTGLTVTLSNVAVIPASGGSVNSCDVSVVANGYVRYDWQSGDSTQGPSTSWTLTSSEYSLRWTGVTAQSKGEITSQQTTAGTLTCQVTYNENISIKETKTATVYQEANQVTGYTPWEYELAVSTNVTGTYPAAGGTVQVDYSGKRKRKPVYTSTATGSTYSYSNIGCDLTSTYGTLASQAVTGAGTTTLTLGANTSGNRTVTITLTYQEDESKKSTTSFTQYGSSYSFAYAYLSNFTGNGQMTTWAQMRDVVREINAASWTSPTQNVYAVTADGSTKYRIGTSPSSNLVQADTYFYNVDSLLFNTRNVTTAGAAGTEHLWYKRPNWEFIQNFTILASDTTFTLTGSTTTSYGVTVKRGTTTIASVGTFTGSLVVNCGENPSTTSNRTFTVTFTENNSSAGNKPSMTSRTITQEKKVAASIDIDHDTWEYCASDLLNTTTVIVNSVGAGWQAQYDNNYFSVSPAAGAAGTTTVVITCNNRGLAGTTKDIIFLSNNLQAGRAIFTVEFLDC